MPNTRRFIDYSPHVSASLEWHRPVGEGSLQIVEGRVRARFYSRLSKKPRMVFVKTRQRNATDFHGRYPFAENLISFQRLQPYVHNCLVILAEGPHTYKFMVFFKRHVLLPQNDCLHKLANGPTILRSDVVVMSVGVNAAYVNMKGREGVLADWVIKRFAKYGRLRRRHLPTKLFYRK